MSTFQELLNGQVKADPAIVHRTIFPALYIYYVIASTVFAIIGFTCFVGLYLINNGCPIYNSESTNITHVNRNEQLLRFKLQKKAEDLLRERDRRRTVETITLNEQA
ncbi:hypothetical protein M3Y98_01189500 [Aphelenchoides besseyi]|nr:hypothetical protein M3Y98_01189500 [Aphelenchoides besseyi]KAI6195035.1 hypothetical protein M3Y96_01188400 [Aphelenchoides besseyi]